MVAVSVVAGLATRISNIRWRDASRALPRVTAVGRASSASRARLAAAPPEAEPGGYAGDIARDRYETHDHVGFMTPPTHSRKARGAPLPQPPRTHDGTISKVQHQPRAPGGSRPSRDADEPVTRSSRGQAAPGKSLASPAWRTDQAPRSELTMRRDDLLRALPCLLVGLEAFLPILPDVLDRRNRRGAGDAPLGRPGSQSRSQWRLTSMPAPGQRRNPSQSRPQAAPGKSHLGMPSCAEIAGREAHRP